MFFREFYTPDTPWGLFPRWVSVSKAWRDVWDVFGGVFHPLLLDFSTGSNFDDRILMIQQVSFPINYFIKILDEGNPPYMFFFFFFRFEFCIFHGVGRIFWKKNMLFKFHFSQLGCKFHGHLPQLFWPRSNSLVASLWKFLWKTMQLGGQTWKGFDASLLS